MPSSKLTRRLFFAAEVLLLVGTVAAAAWLSRSDEWSPPLLVGLLLVLALVGEWRSITISGGQVSASLIAFLLAMSLLGPAPAVALGVIAVAVTSSVRRLPPAPFLNNLSTFAVFPFVGGLTVLALAGNVHDPRNLHMTQSVTFGLIVFAAFIVATGLNIVLIAVDVRLEEGRSLARQVRDVFRPTLLAETATGALAAVLAVAYTNVGLPALFGSIVVLLIFQYLMFALLRSEERADQLEARNIQQVSLQLGILSSLVQALEMRDPTTRRHGSVVARHCKTLAREIGCDEGAQEVVRTAALLHDVGKFTWPDRVLHAGAVTDEDEAIVRRHPDDGAMVVGALHGYGEAADTILYHHERVDGCGYPAGLIGNEIPLASRILAICCTYDTMTARESYRSPMTPQEAMDELRNAANSGQFDSELVESFIEMIERSPDISASDEDIDFVTDFEFERRVREMAQPNPRSSSAGPTSRAADQFATWPRRLMPEHLMLRRGAHKMKAPRSSRDAFKH
jgi:putative nucleotidyltransferase with HDIG domain